VRITGKTRELSSLCAAQPQSEHALLARDIQRPQEFFCGVNDAPLAPKEVHCVCRLACSLKSLDLLGKLEVMPVDSVLIIIAAVYRREPTSSPC
jgi:hypothetical protein